MSQMDDGRLPKQATLGGKLYKANPGRPRKNWIDMSECLTVRKLEVADLHLYDHVAAVAGGIQACTEDRTVPQITRQRKLSATVALTLV